MAITSGATAFTSKLPLVHPLVVTRIGKIIDGTGEAIAEQTKENMTPGHFFYTGLSRDAETTGPAPDAAKQRAEEEAGDNVGTDYENTGPLSGEVRVKTPWAADAEYGTANSAPRPALRPAIDQCWPEKVYELAATLP